VALLRASKALDKPQAQRRPAVRRRDRAPRACEAPIRQIAENAGVDGSVVVGKCDGKQGSTSASTPRPAKYVDMVKAGIIDPTKVVRTALQDAASVAGLLITTEAMIAEKPKKDAPAGGGAGGGMGGMAR
jgi:chaperonin GroEL